MKNEDIKKFWVDEFDKRDRLCIEHGSDIKTIKKDVVDIKLAIARIDTAYKVFITIGSAVGVVIGFLVELFYRST